MQSHTVLGIQAEFTGWFICDDYFDTTFLDTWQILMQRPWFIYCTLTLRWVKYLSLKNRLRLKVHSHWAKMVFVWNFVATLCGHKSLVYTQRFHAIFLTVQKGLNSLLWCCSHITLKYIKKIKGVVGKNDAKNGTCKHSLNWILCESIWKWRRVRVRFRCNINVPLFTQMKHECEIISWEIQLAIGESRISQTGERKGLNLWVWGKSLLFSKISAENCMGMKETEPRGGGGTSLEPRRFTNGNTRRQRSKERSDFCYCSREWEKKSARKLTSLLQRENWRNLKR